MVRTLRQRSGVISWAFPLVLWLALSLLTARAPALAAETVRVGVFTFKPLVFERDGTADGFFIDILKEIAAKEGWVLSYRPDTFTGNLQALERGDIDLMPVIASTEERRALFDFTEDYLFLDWALIYVRKDSRIHSIFDLHGKTIAALEGSVYTSELANLLRQFEIQATIITRAEYSQVLAAVEHGQADAGVCTNVYGSRLEDEHAVVRTDIVFSPIKIRYAVKKGANRDILDALNRAIARLKQDKDSRYQYLYDKWMGFSRQGGAPGWLKWGLVALGGTCALLFAFILTLRALVAKRTRELARTNTELAQANSELQTGEERFRATFEQAAVGLAHVDLTGRWIRVNEKMCEIVGYPLAELMPLSFQDITHPDDLDEDMGNIDLILAGKITHYSMEKRYIRKDGSPIWVLLTVSLVRNADATPRHFVSVIQDITDRKQAEMKLAKAQSYIRNILDSMPSVLVGVDPKGVVTHWNKAAEEAMGIPADRARGSTLESVYPRLGVHLANVRASVELRKPHRIEREMFERDMGIGYQDVMIYPLVSNGVEGAVVRVDDVTQRVQIEEMMIQSEKMVSVGSLAAGMAHEINNPLSAILQSAQVVLSRLESRSAASLQAAASSGCSLESIQMFMDKRGILDFLHGIREAGTRAAQIVANMLEFSRRTEARSPASANALLDKSLELALNDYDLEKKYDFKQIQIVRDYAEDIPDIQCSRTEIEQVILNLLKNAAQAMASAKGQTAAPSITLRTSRTASHVRIDVEDNGPGMPESVRKRIFEPFFTTKRQGEGTGLGLSVSYFIIVTKHGGGMEVESEPGKGTTFHISLPLG